MKIAVVSDVHANQEAFLAVLAEIKRLGVERIYSLGDTVGYGPEPVECLALAVEHCCIRLMGNHEHSIRYPKPHINNPLAQEAMDWTRRQLLIHHKMREATHLSIAHLEEDRLFLHGSVRGPLTDYLSETDDDGLSLFDEVVATLDRDFTKFRICFVGHNHKPFLATAEGFLHPHDAQQEFYLGEEKLYVSVGSVGQPRDRDPRACFVTFDGEVVRFHRVNYPCGITAKKIITAGLPDILGERLSLGR